MPTLCPKLAYYAAIMLDALVCLLCLKLCWHNRHRPTVANDQSLLQSSIVASYLMIVKNASFFLKINTETCPKRKIISPVVQSSISVQQSSPVNSASHYFSLLHPLGIHTCIVNKINNNACTGTDHIVSEIRSCRMM